MATRGGGDLDRLTPDGRGRPLSAPMARFCRSCGERFETRCIPRVIRRSDGSETVRWAACETQCADCQPSLFPLSGGGRGSDWRRP